MLKNIYEDYKHLITYTCAVLPSEEVSDVVVEPYNAVLALHQLINYTDFNVLIDNEALFNTWKRGENGPCTYKGMNSLITPGFSGITSGSRFPGQLNMDVRKLSTNLKPFPR